MIKVILEFKDGEIVECEFMPHVVQDLLFDKKINKAIYRYCKKITVPKEEMAKMFISKNNLKGKL